MKLDDDQLDKLCRRELSELNPYLASEAVVGLGTLARWWLRDDVLEIASQDPGICNVFGDVLTQRPRLPATHGSCWIILAQVNSCLPMLRDAFLLPLEWRAGRSHDPNLPPRLIEVAESVISIMQKGGGLDETTGPQQRWGLWLADDLSEVDLSELHTFTWESAGASLAGGLRIAAVGGTPDRTVWASGAWRGDKLVSVSGIDAKLALAEAWGASELYLPTDVDLASLPQSRIEIGWLRSDSNQPLAILSKYLERLDAIPPRDAPRAKRKDRFLRFQDTSRAKGFYRTHLLNDIADRCREDLPGSLTKCEKVELISVASLSSELLLLAAAVFQPQRMLILHTDDDLMRGVAGEQKRCCTELCTDVTTAPMRDWPQLEHDMREQVNHWRRDVDAGCGVVMDLTPGRKDMSLTLARLTCDRDLAVYLIHRFDTRTHRAVPFTECYRVLAANRRIADEVL